MATTKTNERPGTRAVLRHFHMSASKARLVLDLIRDKDVLRAQEILAATPREAASVVGKVLASAVANAQNNDGQAAEELYVASAFADEGATMKRFRPRARGRATRIRKRSCHITIIVARMDETKLERARATRTTDSASRSRRVAGSRRRADQQSHAHRREVAREEAAVAAEATAAEEAAAEAALADEHEHDHEDHEHVAEPAEHGDEPPGEATDASDESTTAAVEAAAEAPEGDATTASEEHTD
jgi:large subunit ribosomal protein L22